MKQITLTLALLIVAIGSLNAQSIWQSPDYEQIKKIPSSERALQPSKFYLNQINAQALSNRLAGAVDRFSGGVPITVDFPTGKDRFETFAVYDSGAIPQQLMEKYPAIRSYVGTSKQNPLNSIYFTITPQGFRGVITGAKIIYMDPYTGSVPNIIMSYDRKDLNRASDDDFKCHVTGSVNDALAAGSIEDAAQPKAFRDRFFRTYRIAIAVTSEYSSYHNDGNNANGDARADALAGVIVTLARVNSVFEKEMSIRFTLANNNDRLIYFNGTNNQGFSDPYDNYNGSSMLFGNTSNINNRIGSASYDIGHVFSTGGGGIAGSSRCNNTTKGQGVTGIVTPEFDPFDIDYVCHEIGHQFGADHTFYNGCFGGSPSPQPFESGSASTIMGYAGICAPNVQDNSDAYFHAISLQQMHNTLASDTCDSQIALGSNNPTAPDAIDLTAKFLPISTPFKLTVNSAQAPDSGEVYTYSWDQIDTGSARTTGAPQPPLPTNTSGPMFRSIFYTESPTRYFPNLEEVLNGNDNIWESLSSVSRDLTFVATIRDNNVNGGQTDQASVLVRPRSTVGPFEVTSPVSTDVLYEGQNRNVTWSVNGTNRVELATQVNIKLSLDGGYTYPFTLATAVPNTGSYQINVPVGSKTTTARIMVEAVDNYFYNVNNGNFEIKEGTFELTTPVNVITTCAPTNAVFSFAYDAAPGFNQQATFTAVGLPAGVNASFSTGSSTSDVNVTVTLSGAGNVDANQYDFLIRATTASATIDKAFSLKIFNTNVGDVLITAPLNGAGNQVANPLLQWEDLPSASSYLVQVSSQPNFSSILESATVINAISYQTTTLSPGNLYYWRVQPSNGCTTGSVASIASFQTAQDVCRTYGGAGSTVYVNEAQPAGEANQRQWTTGVNAVSAKVIVTDDIEVTNLSFYMNASHDDTGHIKMQLSAPTGRFAEVYNRECAAGRNFNLTVSDQGTQNFGCDPGFTGALTGNQRPGQAFSRFNGASALGEWVLLATDRTSGIGGTFNDFTVTVCGRLQYVNDIDTNRNLGKSVAFNGTTVINQTELRSVKAGVSNANITYVLTRLPKYGSLKLNGTNLVLGNSFTQADLNSNRITYAHTASSLIYNDGFDFVVQSTNDVMITQAVFNITVEEPTLIYNNSWSPFAPNMETGSLNAIVQAGTAPVNTQAQIKDLTVLGLTNNLMVEAPLTVLGNILLTGAIDARTNGTLVFNGTTTQTVNNTGTGKIMADLVTVTNTNGVILAAPLDIYGTLDIANAPLTSNGNLTFKSNATSTGQLTNATGATVFGSVNVERFIPAKRAFRFLASSVNTTGTIYQNWQENGASVTGLGTDITGSATGANGFDLTSSGNASMFGYNNNTQNWFAVPNTNVQQLNVGDPWRVLIRGDRNIDLENNSAIATSTTLRANGSLQIGNYTKAATTAAGDFIFIANPFQAAVDLKTTLNDASTTGVNPNFVYYWDPNLNTRGGYATVDMSTTNGSPIPSSSASNKYLQPGQSFFVRATGAASVTFKETAKAITAAQTAVFSTPAPASRINITLLDVNGQIKDQTVTSFDSIFSNGLDANDALKFGNLDESLSIATQGSLLAIERRAIPLQDELTVLHISSYRASSYRFTITLENMNGLEAILVDRYLNTNLVLSNGANTVPFTVDTAIPQSVAANRFAIKYVQSQLSNRDVLGLAQDLNLYPNPSSDGNFNLSSSLFTGEQVTIYVYNAMGQLVHSQNDVANATILVRPATQLATGMYIVKINTGKEQAAIQLLIK